MSDNDWIKQLQSKMEGHKESVPDDLWNDIEARLPESQMPHQSMPAWRRYAAAAAVALAVLGTGSLLWQNHHQVATEKPANIAKTSDRVDNTPIEEVLAQNETTALPMVDEHANHTTAIVKKGNLRSVNTQPATTNTSDHVAQVKTSVIEEAPQDIEGEQCKEEELKSAEQMPLRQAIMHDKVHTTAQPQPLTGATPKSSRQRLPLALSLYASNNIRPKENATENLVFYADAYTLFHQTSDVAGIYLPEDIFTEKHHAPLSLGLNVKIPLNHRLALTSGVVYSRLKSDFTSSRKRREQTLHYLGVPLNVTYTLWDYRRFSIYVIGGMQADFNVKASLKEASTPSNDISIDKDRVQFSGLIGPGLQLDLTRDLGIYVEPTGRYYFNNGSHVLNYFKDKPLNFNFNAGLRLTLH